MERSFVGRGNSSCRGLAVMEVLVYLGNRDTRPGWSEES